MAGADAPTSTGEGDDAFSPWETEVLGSVTGGRLPLDEFDGPRSTDGGNASAERCSEDIEICPTLAVLGLSFICRW